MGVDLAEVAYTAWAEEHHAARRRAAAGGAEVVFDDLPTWAEAEDAPVWVAVEAEFVRQVQAGQSMPAPVEYTLEMPLPEMRRSNGEALPPGKYPVSARTFEVRRPTATDCLAAEQKDGAERDFRVIYSCLKPKMGRTGMWTWSLFEQIEEGDLGKLEELVLDGRERLEGHLYEAWRAAAEELWAVEAVSRMELRAEVVAHVELEQGRHAPRHVVLKALEERLVALTDSSADEAKAGDAEAGDAEAKEGVGGVEDETQEFEGEAGWLEAPTWTDVVLAGAPDRYVWMQVAFALCTATEDGHDELRLFTPGLPAKLRPRGHMNARDHMAIRRGKTGEEQALNLVASLCGVEAETLRRARIDDYERIFMAGLRWRGNLQRERAARMNGGPSGSPKSSAKSRP